MEFPVKKKELATHNKYRREVLDIAFEFAKQAHKECGNLIKAIVLFGSSVRKGKSNDIDILIIVDAHNIGVYSISNNTVFDTILKIIHSNTDLTIVTNRKLKKIVENNGGKVAILPDRIAKLDCNSDKKNDDSFWVTYICTYSEDEPFIEVFKAAKLLPNNIKVFVKYQSL